jgi:hypothetical protein
MLNIKITTFQGAPVESETQIVPPNNFNANYIQMGSRHCFIKNLNGSITKQGKTRKGTFNYMGEDYIIEMKFNHVNSGIVEQIN